MSLSKAMMSL